ncbi:MAG: hypothetical protein JNK46_02535 [Methylobacteriaceae bacterium]|nr:hypothetical protein [Methylobacteriaceae bacterium]
MRPFALALATLLAFAAGAAAQTAPAPPADGKLPPHSRDKLTELVSKLTAEKLDAVMAANGLEVPKDFFGCLCANAPRTVGVGSRYVEGQCEQAGLGTWRVPLPGDQKTWAACLSQHRYPDGRTIVDVLADAAASRRRPAGAASFANPGQALRGEIAALTKLCLPVGDLGGLLDRYDREHADYVRRRQEIADRAGELRGRPLPHVPSPDSEWIVDDIRNAIAAAPNPCEQAAEAALIAEKANVRQLGDYVAALATTWYAPGGDDALDWVGKLKRVAGVWGLVDKGGAIVDFAKEARAQAKHKAHAEAIEEARELIRASRGWTKEIYDGAIESYSAEADAKWTAIRQAADTLKETLADIDRRRLKRPPGDGFAQRQYDTTLDNEESYAKAVRAVTTRDALVRLDEIKFLRDTLERFRKPMLGRTCEQWMAQACAEAAKK